MRQHYRTTGNLAFAAGLAGAIFMIGLALLGNTNAITGEPPPERYYHLIFVGLTLLFIPPFVLLALFFFSLRRLLIPDRESLAWSLMGLLITAEFIIRLLMWLFSAYLIFHSNETYNDDLIIPLIGFTFDIGLILQLLTIFLAGWIMPATLPTNVRRGTLILVVVGFVLYTLSGFAIFSLLANLAGLLWMLLIGSYFLLQAAR